MSPTHYAVPRGGNGGGGSLRLPDFNMEKTDMGEGEAVANLSCILSLYTYVCLMFLHFVLVVFVYLHTDFGIKVISRHKII